MNPLHAIVDRFDNLSDYLRSSEFKTNPKSNIFTPLRKAGRLHHMYDSSDSVKNEDEFPDINSLSISDENISKAGSSEKPIELNDSASEATALLRKVSFEPAADNYLPLPHELKFAIAKHLNLKDFAAFSSINVNNYLTLRSDDLLVEKVLENSHLRLVDLRNRAHESNGGRAHDYHINPCNSSIQPPPQAYIPGPAQLTRNTNPESFKVFHQNKSAFFFSSLCQFAINDLIDTFFRDRICSLVIDINNTIDLNGDMRAVYYANAFLEIAKDVYVRAPFEDKENKLETLAHMIEEKHLDLRNLESCYIDGNEPDLSNWDNFLSGLREDNQ